MQTSVSDGLEPQSVLEGLSDRYQAAFEKENYLLSFPEFISTFVDNPDLLSRNAAMYLVDMIKHFDGGSETNNKVPTNNEQDQTLKLFSEQNFNFRPAIVGQNEAHKNICHVLEQFTKQGRIDKLILLHGPNGSSKSSTIEMFGAGLEKYSKTTDGAIYRFNWIFPNDKIDPEQSNVGAPNVKIGFGDEGKSGSKVSSYAYLKEDDIQCKIISEMKENPIFLLPPEERVTIYRAAYKKKHGKDVREEDIPPSLFQGALSSKSKKIFDALTVAYKGDIQKVLKHVQVERFTLSSRYRTGIATVHPQMNVDAQDRQLTMEKSYQNLPAVLQNIRIFEPVGELVDANRGYIEFSDLLKRPVEAFKYLLTTIEKMEVALSSGIASLDLVMLASSNEKHLDAFKASPDWASFKGRIELVRVPYLLNSKNEELIYKEDAKIIEHNKKFGPHALSLLAKWAVLSRLRQPDPEAYEFNVRGLISKLDPFEKLALYDGAPLSDKFTDDEKKTLLKIGGRIKKECQSSVAYEGRFGASPREMKMLLYFASQNSRYDTVSAIAVLEEIEKLLKDRTVYDYLQFETRGHYHDVHEFMKYIRRQYGELFHNEFLSALNLFDEKQYSELFSRYLNHIVAEIKNEKVENKITGNHEDPNEQIMDDVEELLGVTKDKKAFRERTVSRIASWKVENPSEELDLDAVFKQEMATISSKIYESKKDTIQKILDGMLTHSSEDYEKLDAKTKQLCEDTFNNLESRFGYTRKTAWDSLIFLRNFSHQDPAATLSAS